MSKVKSVTLLVVRPTFPFTELATIPCQEVDTDRKHLLNTTRSRFF